MAHRHSHNILYILSTYFFMTLPAVHENFVRLLHVERAAHASVGGEGVEDGRAGHRSPPPLALLQ